MFWRTIIVRPLADLAEAKPTVEGQCRDIGLVDLQEQRLGALAVQAAQHRIHQLPAEPLPAMGAGDCNRQDFALARGKPRQHKTDRRLGTVADLTGGEAENGVLAKQQYLDLQAYMQNARKDKKCLSLYCLKP